jgi:hypothetical protein
MRRGVTPELAFAVRDRAKLPFKVARNTAGNLDIRAKLYGER